MTGGDEVVPGSRGRGLPMRWRTMEAGLGRGEAATVAAVRTSETSRWENLGSLGDLIVVSPRELVQIGLPWPREIWLKKHPKGSLGLMGEESCQTKIS